MQNTSIPQVTVVAMKAKRKTYAQKKKSCQSLQSEAAAGFSAFLFVGRCSEENKLRRCVCALEKGPALALDEVNGRDTLLGRRPKGRLLLLLACRGKKQLTCLVLDTDDAWYVAPEKPADLVL